MLIAKVVRADTSLRITIPRPICHALGLKQGDEVILTHVAPNQVVIQNLRGILESAREVRV